MAETFEALKVVKRQIQDMNRSCYRVYKSAEEFVTVEATTALEAIQESGVQGPKKVERVLHFEDRLLDQQRLLPEKDEIVFPIGEIEVAELAPTQVRADKEADKASGFSEMPLRQGDADSIINPEVEEMDIPEATTSVADDNDLQPFFTEAESPSTPLEDVVAISGDGEDETSLMQNVAEPEEVETLSEAEVAALLNEKPAE